MRLKNSNKRKIHKHVDIKNMFLRWGGGVKREIKREITKYLEINENGNATY